MWQNDSTLTQIRWFVAPPGARAIPFPTYYGSGIWRDIWMLPTPVGSEVDPAAWDRGLNSDGYRGRSFCGGARAWIEGGVHGVDPAFATDNNGRSPCCGVRPQLGSLGSGSGLRSRQWNFSTLGSGSALVSSQSYGYRQPSLVASGSGLVSDQYSRHVQPSLVGSGSGLVSRQGYQYLQVGLIGSGSGLISVQEADVAIVGEIRAFAGGTVPINWLECNGAMVSQTTYAALYAALSATWGPGGIGTFSLPDLRGRALRGRGGISDAILGNTVGAIGGERTHLLVPGEGTIENHAHGPGAGTDYWLTGTGGASNISGGSGPTVDFATVTAAAGPTPATTAHNNTGQSAVVLLCVYAGP